MERLETSHLHSENPSVVVNTDYRLVRKTPQIKAALGGSVGAFVLGTFIGWSSPVQPQLQNNITATNLTNEYNSIWYISLNADQMSWVSSLINLGALFGALSGGFLMDNFGRKFILTVTSIPYLLAWILIAAAVNPSMLYIGRFIGGFTGGICSVVSPTYLVEISTPNLRGLLSMCFSTMMCTGILFTSLLGWLNWRAISGISAFCPTILIVLCFVPESPYYLLKNGRKNDALKALKWLRGSGYNTETEILQLKTRLDRECLEKYSISNIFQRRAVKPLLLSICLMVFQQLSGINAAVYNAVAIFESAGSTLNALVCAILLNLDQLIVTIISLLLVEHLGRRTLFVISEVVMCISMFTLGTFFYLKENAENDNSTITSLGWIPLFSLILFIAAFGIGAGPVPWTMCSELLPPNIKGPGVSIATFSNWILAFIVTKTFVNMQEALTSAGAFWMFGSFCVFGTLFGLFLLPETKGKTPEEIQAVM